MLQYHRHRSSDENMNTVSDIFVSLYLQKTNVSHAENCVYMPFAILWERNLNLEVIKIMLVVAMVFIHFILVFY